MPAGEAGRLVRDLVRSDVPFTDLEVRPTSLEEAFLTLTHAPAPVAAYDPLMSPPPLTHAKFQIIEISRIPIAIIGSAFWPAASMLAFVVPFVGQEPVYATYATASMVTVAVMSTNLFQYGIGVSEDRAHPWDPFVRTLPAGPGPRLIGRILSRS